MHIFVIHSFQICASNSVDLQNSQDNIIEIGMRTPYIFTSNKGRIKLAYCEIFICEGKSSKEWQWQWQIHTESTILNLVAGQAPKGPRKDQVRKNIRLCTIVFFI